MLKAGLCPFLTDSSVETLRSKGYTTIADFVSVDPEEVVSITSLPYKDVVAARHMLGAQFAALATCGADLYQQVLASVAILSTGCASLDGLLDGGLYGSEVTEVTGPAASGKTQICLSAALHLARMVQQNAVYIDTKGGLDTARLQDMLEATVTSEQEAHSVCSRLMCYKAYDTQELLSVLEMIKENMRSQQEDFYCRVKLVVLDCVTSVVLPVLGGQCAEGHGMMMYIARMIKSLAAEFSLAVLVTNNMVGSFEGVSRPALGKSWQYVPNVRVELQRAQCSNSLDVRLAQLSKSCRQPLGSKAFFKITSAGLESATVT